MKKTLFLTALLALFIFSCIDNEELTPVDESSISPKIEVISYNYKGENYSLKFDVSDEENSILLESENNEILSNIYQDHNQLVTVYVNETTFYLYNSMKDYEKSDLYFENENKAAAFKESIKTKKKSIANRNTVSISANLPAFGTNFNSEAYMYRRSKLRFSSRGYYVNLNGGNNPPFFAPDFRYLSNSGYYYGGLGGSKIPESEYNTYGSVNHNDAISSLYINLMKVTIYEHQNYSGKAKVFDARANPYARIKVKRLRDLKYSCGFICWRNWNDKISSAIYQN
jgi:hypothetical protein